jgi:hypothetical protein
VHEQLEQRFPSGTHRCGSIYQPVRATLRAQPPHLELEAIYDTSEIVPEAPPVSSSDARMEYEFSPPSRAISGKFEPQPPAKHGQFREHAGTPLGETGLETEETVFFNS